jgi:NADP-dependent 3-hydroxy acid dehydrogenase YdfG
MVKLTTVQQHNAHFAKEQHEGVVSVFAGATRGIGTSTLERMATMLHKSTFYILGRSAKRFQSQLEKLKNSNSSCNFVFIEADVSLLSNVDAACKPITSCEKKVDYLYMSAGLVPLNGPECTEYASVVFKAALLMSLKQTREKVSRHASPCLIMLE